MSRMKKEERNENAEKIGENGEQIAGSAGKITGAEAEGEQDEVPCLGIAEDAAVQHIGKSFEEAARHGEGQKYKEGIFGRICLGVFHCVKIL